MGWKGGEFGGSVERSGVGRVGGCSVSLGVGSGLERAGEACFCSIIKQNGYSCFVRQASHLR